MTDWDRLEIQTDRILALTPQERLYALLSLRYTDPGALDGAITKALAWRAEKAAERAS